MAAVATMALGLALAAAPSDHSASLMGEGTDLLQPALEEAGFAIEAMTVRWPVDCDAALADEPCWTLLYDAWEAAGPRTRFLLAARVRPRSVGRRVEVVVIDGRDGTLVADLDAFHADDDLVFPLALGPEVVHRIDARLDPVPPPTQAELDELMRLDDPAIVIAPPPPPTDVELLEFGEIEVDLRSDFAAYCRTGPRKRRTDADSPYDFRPRCQLGPFFGYWTGASWATLGFLTGSLTATGIAFGLHRSAPADNRSGLAIGGSVAAAFSAVLTGALVGRIIRDRRRARSYIREEKALARLAGL